MRILILKDGTRGHLVRVFYKQNEIAKGRVHIMDYNSKYVTWNEGDDVFVGETFFTERIGKEYHVQIANYRHSTI